MVQLLSKKCIFVHFGEAIAARAVIAIASGSNERVDRFLEPAK